MKTVKHVLYAATLAGSLAGLFGAAQAAEHPDAALAREAKIGSVQARSIALKTFPGTVVKAELEREQGGQRTPLFLCDTPSRCPARSRGGCQDGQDPGKPAGSAKHQRLRQFGRRAAGLGRRR
ncbi:MAG: PepSY domain-containing protein [Pseudomonadota bacterium]